MQRWAGLRPTRGQAAAAQQPPPAPIQPPVAAGDRGHGIGRGRGRASAAAAAAAAASLPLILQQHVVAPVVPRPPDFPVVIPPLPGDPAP
jgi:hypothetical protein